MNYEDFMTGLVRRDPGETEFHQAVGEVAMSVILGGYATNAIADVLSPLYLYGGGFCVAVGLLPINRLIIKLVGQ